MFDDVVGVTPEVRERVGGGGELWIYLVNQWHTQARACGVRGACRVMLCRKLIQLPFLLGDLEAKCRKYKHLK